MTQLASRNRLPHRDLRHRDRGQGLGCGGEASGVRARCDTSRGSSRVATDREVAVIAAVLVTGSEKAAAYRLGLSHSTVKHHLASARAKVGATTTAQLV